MTSSSNTAESIGEHKQGHLQAATYTGGELSVTIHVRGGKRLHIVHAYVIYVHIILYGCFFFSFFTVVQEVTFTVNFGLTAEISFAFIRLHTNHTNNVFVI